MGCMRISSCCCAAIGVLLDLRRVSQGISGVSYRKSSHLSCMMWNAGWLWSQCRGVVLHLKLICGTTSYFTFLRWHQCLSRRVTVFLVTLWSSFKQIKATNVFDWEHGIALPAMQGHQVSSRGKGEFSRYLSSFGRNLGYILDLSQE